MRIEATRSYDLMSAKYSVVVLHTLFDSKPAARDGSGELSSC